VNPTPRPNRLAEIIDLSRQVAEPGRDLVILAEGNISLRTGPTSMVVKATGSEMRRAGADDFVEVDLREYWDMIDQADIDDDAVTQTFARAWLAGSGRPSVESLLHAVCIELPEIDAVIHTHPVAVNALLCSDQAELLVAGNLFPDQIVVLGRHSLLIPYVDPGLELARHVREALGVHRDQHGGYPKAIYLRNHGLFALGASIEDALQITEMAVKVARVLLGALAAGRPSFMDERSVERIDTRPDEILRRSILSATHGARD